MHKRKTLRLSKLTLQTLASAQLEDLWGGGDADRRTDPRYTCAPCQSKD